MAQLVRSIVIITVLGLTVASVGMAHAQEADVIRLYISEVIGPPDLDFYTTALQEVSPRPAGFRAQAAIPVHPGTGVPVSTWALVVVSITDGNWGPIDADARNFRLFQGGEGERATSLTLLLTLDAVRWGDLSRRTVVRNKLQEVGVPVGDITNTTSLRAVLQKVGRHLFPAFNELTFEP